MKRREALLLALGWAVVLHDAWSRGLAGEVNGRLLGFLDSLAHCASWVAVPGLPSDIGFWERLMGSVATKHGGNVLASAVLHITPAFLQGWEYNFPFVVALVLAHSLRFVPRVVRTRTGPWRALFVTSSALYKSRKLRFAVQNATSVVTALFLGIMTMELTGWLAIAARGVARGQPAAVWSRALVQDRFLISVIASLACYNGGSAPLLLALLMLHKFLAPFNVETSVLDPFDDYEEAAAVARGSPVRRASVRLSEVEVVEAVSAQAVPPQPPPPQRNGSVSSNADGVVGGLRFRAATSTGTTSS